MFLSFFLIKMLELTIVSIVLPDLDTTKFKYFLLLLFFFFGDKLSTNLKFFFILFFKKL